MPRCSFLCPLPSPAWPLPACSWLTRGSAASRCSTAAQNAPLQRTCRWVGVWVLGRRASTALQGCPAPGALVAAATPCACLGCAAFNHRSPSHLRLPLPAAGVGDGLPRRQWLDPAVHRQDGGPRRREERGGQGRRQQGLEASQALVGRHLGDEQRPCPSPVLQGGGWGLGTGDWCLAGLLPAGRGAGEHRSHICRPTTSKAPADASTYTGACPPACLPICRLHLPPAPPTHPPPQLNSSSLTAACPAADCGG